MIDAEPAQNRTGLDGAAAQATLVGTLLAAAAAGAAVAPHGPALIRSRL